MKWSKLIGLFIIGVFLLGACSNNDSPTNKKASDKQTESPNQEITGNTTKPSLKEDQNVPEAEKKALLAVTDQYIKAFNEKNLDAYMATISKNPTSFKYDEEKAYTKKVFDTMDVKMEPTKITVIGYKPNSANVYIALKTTVASKGEKVVKTSRQVNTYHKENGQWKLTSIMVMQTK
ncbi:nuclear transport factor 2 family protein [Bacillus sp. APMAM]|nr:nuclear transport factor 2 family protein [Bacillus sp. APMAM]RTZ55607.1 nuclear transport factor 2 family protein [Bacillus sp. SAJ1]